MNRAFKRFLFLKSEQTKKDKALSKAISNIFGYRPYNVKLYWLAMQHTSIAKINKTGLKESNERLEYLGDAILGSIVAEYLFKKYPYKDEGFLTEIRSRIVNREALNALGIKLGLNKLVEFDTNRGGRPHKSIYGNTLEAVIGALYLDIGYKRTKKIINKKIIPNYYDLDEIINQDPNFKSKIIEWAQKDNHDIRFDVEDISSGKKSIREFKAQVIINDELAGEGFGVSKKKAEQAAARKSCEKFNI